MNLKLAGIEDGGWIPERFAFGIPDPDQHMRLGENLNPQVEWVQVPAGTETMVLLCFDDDVPADPTHVNQEGHPLTVNLPRTRFFHWILVDLPSGTELIEEGCDSQGVTPKGKKEKIGPSGSRQGLNDYTSFMQNDPDMKGEYFGYDGPCPPWNDERLHHYRFVLHATDLVECPVDGGFTGRDVEKAIEGHILGSASITGLYSLNPELIKHR